MCDTSIVRYRLFKGYTRGFSVFPSISIKFSSRIPFARGLEVRLSVWYRPTGKCIIEEVAEARGNDRLMGLEIDAHQTLSLAL